MRANLPVRCVYEFTAPRRENARTTDKVKRKARKKLFIILPERPSLT